MPCRYLRKKIEKKNKEKGEGRVLVVLKKRLCICVIRAICACIRSFLWYNAKRETIEKRIFTTCSGSRAESE